MIPPPCAATTRLVLLRHGEVHAEDRKALYGQADVRLSERGEAQSEATARHLARLPVRAVYSSDLVRAHFLAKLVAARHGLAPVVSPALRERFFGHWQGKVWAEIERTHPEEHARYQGNRFTMRAPGGAENFQDVQHRVLPFIAELIPRHRGQTIVLAAHSGPLRLVLAQAMLLPLQAVFTFEQDYCCVNVIDYRPESPRVMLLNGTHHLEGV